ncbi:hypothetical protein V6N12_047429 [Hibiscus sabdariffa]|uniref:Uncharacterized protein n=1 Tax=Hibiscus sabdariffa TaxID=183260 RepID=A0ABR2DDQ3_9ROSI
MGFNSSPVNPGRVSPLSSDPRRVSHLLHDPRFQSRSLGQRSVSDLGLHSGTINMQDVSGFGHAKSVDTNPGSSQVSSSFKALPCFDSEHQTSDVLAQLGLGQSDVGFLSSAQSASGLLSSLADLENSTSIKPVASGSQEVQPTDGPFVVNQHPMYDQLGSDVDAKLVQSNDRRNIDIIVSILLLSSSCTSSLVETKVICEAISYTISDKANRRRDMLPSKAGSCKPLKREGDVTFSGATVNNVAISTSFPSLA